MENISHNNEDVFWDVVSCSLIEIDWCFRGAYCLAMMTATVITSETLIDFYQTTWCKIPEDRYLHIHRHENLKSQP
jgi:hypothetical protein